MGKHTPQEILTRYWGLESFRPLQEEVIQSVLEGKDTLVLIPTGGGKSICYQIPALLLDGICLVVSPLISLMKDQVQQLNSKGIKARCLTAGTNSLEQEIIFNNCITGNVKLLYVSPERLKQRIFREHFRRMKVSMIAVDEAHCISQWGYDFRPAYLDIAQIRAYHPQAPIIALTATATQEVAKDIQEKLLFKPQRSAFQTSFRRSNISFMVFQEMDKEGRLLRITQKVPGCGIVYVRNRRRTKEIASFLTGQGIPTAYYHAGLDPKERDIAQNRWMTGEVSVIVATNAFGMGIDKPDVRYVVHMDIPSSIEAYYQEVGRAGRDGQKSYAVLLYNENDLKNLQQNFETEFPSRQQIANIYRAICNYYQIPIGSGENCVFDFDMEGLCATYNIKILDLFAASRFLEREGLLSLPDRDDSESTIYIPISREDLYRFQIEQVRYCDLIALILRMYGGLFSDFVPISEKAIARRMYMSEEQIKNMLLHIDALKVINYKPKRTKAAIIFTSPRIDAKDLYLSDSNYKELKERALKRMDAMREYATDIDKCRMQQLLAYFGEENSEVCNSCDVCISHKKKDIAPTLREEIIALLKSTPMRADILLAKLNNIDEKEAKTTLRQLIDEQIISINERLELFI